MMATARNYLIVTASYWGFTLVDGALRMLVLFHFFRLGYTPFTLAFLFLLYETAGIGANLAGGYFASRFGIPRMLAVGQTLQIAGLIMLSALNPGDAVMEIVRDTWAVGLSYGGTTFEAHTTVVFDRVTGARVAGLPNPLNAQAALYADSEILAQTEPGCCGSGVTLYDPNNLVEDQVIADAVA